MRKSTHYILLGATLLLTIVCGILIPRTKVNSDMTKYLPDHSPMKQGLEVITSEFGEMPTGGDDIRVMFSGLNDNEKPALQELLSVIPDVQSVRYRSNEDNQYTLYELTVPQSVDQKALGQQIGQRFSKQTVIETSQDGATPPLSVMLLAGLIILAVLILMAQSWMEPLIFLLTCGIAVVLNMGTNALLPSVSITTNYIGSILQLVLSLDYCVVLMNRYRREQEHAAESPDSVVEVLNRSITRAYPSIMSSALTTILGLIMLCFMRLKIGADLGIVLAKGVLWSLVCTFTVLPSLLLLFNRLILHSIKRSYTIPTNNIGRIAAKLHVPLTVVGVLLFVLAFVFSQKTGIYFSTNGESKIDEVFPRANATVLIFDNQDTDAAVALADSMQGAPGMQVIISYPTLLQRQYNAPEMAKKIQKLGKDFADFIPSSEYIDMMTPDMMQLLYAMHSGQDQKTRIAFPDLLHFIDQHCLNNPMFASAIDSDMRAQMALLRLLTAQEDETEEEVAPEQDTAATPAEETVQEVIIPMEEIIPEESVVPVVTPVENDATEHVRTVPVVDFGLQLYRVEPNAVTMDLRSLVDTVTLKRQMGINEMAAFVGSSIIQTRLVFGYDKRKSKTMTPLQYVRLLTHDLFLRPELNGLISEAQKDNVRRREQIMTLALQDAQLTPEDMAKLATDFGVEQMNEDRVWAIMHPAPRQLHPEDSVVNTTDIASAMLPTEPIADKDSIKIEQVVPVEEPVLPKPLPKQKSREERQADLFMSLMYSGRTYTAEQMGGYFRQLGQDIDNGTVRLLYTYYTSVMQPDSSHLLSIEQLLGYLSDTLANDPRITKFIDADSRRMMTSICPQMEEGLGMLRNNQYSLMIFISSLAEESADTYQYIDHLTQLTDRMLEQPHYLLGESVMYSEMKSGFHAEMRLVTLLTILAIFLIIAISFRSLLIPTILVITVMTAVYVNVIVAGLMSGQMLYLAYLIVQSILMGATIDYGILFTNHYREHRSTMEPKEALLASYRSSIRTIMTSGLIMVGGPGVMALFIQDVTIQAIVGCLSIGALVAVLLILVVLPGILVSVDKIIIRKQK